MSHHAAPPPVLRTLTPVQLRFNDIDLAGHVNNSVYLCFFEQGRMDFLRNIIAKDHDWTTSGLILAHTEVDYRIPIVFTDLVEVETWCTKVGGKSFNLDYRVHASRNGLRRLHAEGNSVLVCFDYRAQASIGMPSAWRTNLARMMEGEQPETPETK